MSHRWCDLTLTSLELGNVVIKTVLRRRRKRRNRESSAWFLP